MKIGHIFVLRKDRLYAVSYDDMDDHVLADLYNKWTDVQYLEEFFNNHECDLRTAFYGYISIEQAIERTIEEAEELLERLYELAQNEPGNQLDTLFRPLDDNVYVLENYQKSKAKGLSSRKSWLRIYAIRYDDVYIITGGAIKLTLKMQGRQHLEEELKKLNKVRDYLKNDFDEDDFIYTEINH
jgi:hypothetical protein